MKIYHYHPEYKYFICEGTANPSPLDPPGVWLIPAHATEIEPPEFFEGFIPIFNNDSWEIVKDNRGIYYNINTFEQFINDDPLTIPENYTKDVPPEVPEGKKLVWNNGWILEDIPVPPPLTPHEKIESIGLTVDDLKVLLGIS